MSHFNGETAERIIARAARLQNKGDVVESDLYRIADQLGIKPEILRQAINEEEEEVEREKKNGRKKRKQLNAFIRHLFSYLIVIGFLLIIDLITGPGLWFYWPALGWGLGLAMHAMPVVLSFTKLDGEKADS